MPSPEQIADFRRRAAQVRIIAEGIFDKEERETLLRFIDDSEKLAAIGNF